MFIDDLQHGGYKPFRDHTKNVLVNHRNAVYGLQIKDTAEDEAEWKSEKFGDLQFAHFFEGVQGRRDCGSWSLATPAFWHNFQVRPILNDLLGEDIRYKLADVASVLNRDHAKGIPGIVLAASQEDEEHKLFFPAFSDLIAHHLGESPPDYSSLVYDIKATGEVDYDTGAGLHSHLWSKKITGDLNALAWNLTKSTGDETGWGLFVANSGETTGGLVRIGQTVQKIKPLPLLAYASHEKYGPLHPGAGSDKHFIKNTFSGPLNSGHLSFNSYFFANSEMDAPLDFEFAYHPQTREGGFPHQVHLQYDQNATHGHLTGDKRGMWRWHVKIPLAYIPPPTPKIPPDFPPPGTPVPPVTPIPKDPVGPPPTPVPGPDNGGKEKEPPWTPGLPGWDPKWGPAPQPDEGGIFSPTGPAKKIVAAAKKPFGLVQAAQKMMLPGLAIQAHPARTNEKYEKYKADPKIQDKITRDWPSVAQLEGYGKETTPGKFDKTSNPQDRYGMGSAPGGIAIFPPEIGMDDFDYQYAPPNTTISDSYITLLNDKVHLAFGHPDPSRGRPISGFKLANESTEFLSLRQFDSSGADIGTGYLDIYHNASVRGAGAPDLDIVNTNADADTNSGYLKFQGRATGAAYTVRQRFESISGAPAMAWHAGTTRLMHQTADGTLNFEGSVGNLDLSGATTGKAIVKQFQLTTSPTSGYVLKSDASGNGTWQADSTGPTGSGTDNRLVRWNGTADIQDSLVSLDDLGAMSGLTGLATSAFQLTTGAVSGYILQSDVSGNASWVAGPASSTGWTRSAPNIYPTTITDKIGIGTDSPSADLHISRDDDSLQRISSHHNTTTKRCSIDFYRSANTAVSPSAVGSGAVLGSLEYFPYVGGAYTKNAGLVATATGAASGTNLPGSFEFQLNDGTGIANRGGFRDNWYFMIRSSGGGYTQMKASGASNISYTLPTADGSSGQILSTSGAGILSWVSAATGSFKVGSWTSPTSTGNQSITSVGFQPSMIIFVLLHPTSTSREMFAYGVTDGTTSWAVSQDNNTVQRHDRSTTQPIYWHDGAAIIQAATFVSFDASGFTINWTNVYAPSGFLWGYIAFG